MRVWWAVALWISVALAAPARAEDAAPATGDAGLRQVDPWDQGADYRTIRAGEGFRTSVFGRDFAIEPRDRRSTSALDLGVAAYFDGPDEGSLIPFASLYFWRRPDEQWFLRATVGGLYNDVIAARSLGDSHFEGVFAFENNTVPFEDNAQYVDGERNRFEELRKMSVRGGLGVGYRRQLIAGWQPLVFGDRVDPQKPDDMFSIYLLAEPRFLYFQQRNGLSNFEIPDNTFELDGRLAMRWDQMERNLLDLVHNGFATGFDATYGWRANWHDWGIDRMERADRGRYPKLLQAYAVAATGIPGLGERHRLIPSVHAGWGWNVDRFSEARVGGGPSGNEYMSLASPTLPGAGIHEFTPKHYAIALAEYRYELLFFTYLSAYGGVAWLDRERLQVPLIGFTGGIDKQNDLLYPVGARLTTGFAFHSQLQLEYNYNFDVIRDRHRGGGELVLHVSKSF
ncbi:MAG TPA: hypothetical protein VKH41_07175 [Myxococcota bacterium]|nr:hypothetical protein [Myxococcota bacterium]